MINVFLFVLGAIVGSFLNVVGLRWDLLRHGGGLSTLGGRSSCPSCRKVLEWYELIPIFSFLILRGRCLSCGGKISWQYPIVELWTGLIFVTVSYIFIPVFFVYIVITIYDLRHKIIPNPFLYSLFITLFSIGSRDRFYSPSSLQSGF